MSPLAIIKSYLVQINKSFYVFYFHSLCLHFIILTFLISVDFFSTSFKFFLFLLLSDLLIYSFSFSKYLPTCNNIILNFVKIFISLISLLYHFMSLQQHIHHVANVFLRGQPKATIAFNVTTSLIYCFLFFFGSLIKQYNDNLK
ncbi:hypothetical protein RFI_14514 [Reticulomyxa filosa]|uniref:Uncharacterized protein n=1 Tax=Reticulomyxa filosa TaxID=46433 RepID=X6N9U5_RETFI|nr:hypothetical protein RFI_14514 [Reticulomyxa filosa]|eukprot:ETO22683.1 hypothetical protein RFI_14514 [Reticulomyxa filosa]